MTTLDTNFGVAGSWCHMDDNWRKTTIVISGKSIFGTDTAALVDNKLCNVGSGNGAATLILHERVITAGNGRPGKKMEVS